MKNRDTGREYDRMVTVLLEGQKTRSRRQGECVCVSLDVLVKDFLKKGLPMYWVSCMFTSPMYWVLCMFTSSCIKQHSSSFPYATDWLKLMVECLLGSQGWMIAMWIVISC